MEEIYEIIKNRILAAGYTGHIDGAEIYNEINDEIEDKEPGTYIFMSKKDGGIFFEYKLDVMEDQFNLFCLDIHTPDQVFHIDFDA